MSAVGLLLLACTNQAPADSATKDRSAWYADWDADGFGDPASDSFAAAAPPGFVSNADDCDDTRPDVAPGAPEFCDGVDNNCDGVADPADSVGAPEWWADSDGDGAGDPEHATVACEAPPGTVRAGERDCDDADATIAPGAADACGDGVDADCDGFDDLCGRERSLGLAAWWIEGDTIGGRLGSTVALARDGTREAAVSLAPVHDDTPCLGLVIAGDVDGPLTPADAAAQIADVCAIWSFADMDGDGIADVLGTVATDAGLYAWKGPVRGFLDVTDATISWGTALPIGALSDDVDGDGLRDVWATNTDSSGTQLVLLPGSGGRTPLASLGNAANYGSLEDHLDAGHDLDGDGTADAVVWERRANEYWSEWEPSITVYFGPFAEDRTFADADGRVDLEWPAAEGSLAAGDVDGDGTDELVIGIHDGDTSPGLVVVFAEAPGPGYSIADAWWHGDGAADEDHVGSALRADADADGDGHADLYAGATGIPDGWQHGGTDVMYGPLVEGTWSFDTSDERWVGDGWGQAGAALDAADINGDGHAELLLGAPTWDALQNRGAAWWLSGAL